MWIFLRNSLLSILDQDDPSGASLLVRAWHDADIRAIFPDACVVEDSDGAFSARIERRVVTEVIADQIESIRTPDLLPPLLPPSGTWAPPRDRHMEAGTGSP